MSTLPCTVGMLEGWPSLPAEIHHVVEGNKRLGHQFTVCLSAWSHRGVLPGHMPDIAAAKKQFGPSLELHKREFVLRYGTERQLVEIQDRIIAAVREAAKRGEYLERMALMNLTNRLHREIVLGIPGNRP